VKRIPTALRSKASKVKLLLLDVDGVLTDGGIYIDDRGLETKRFDVRDGQGITLLQRAGVRVGLITGRFSRVVRFRARELGIDIVHQRVADKARIYETIKRKARLQDHEIAYIGDDFGDLPVLRRVGLAITVQDSWAAIKPEVDYVTRAKGGHGAVREAAELLLQTIADRERLTDKPARR
jgi:3-deoxy-D-manno-octulosonate 8-phosphate phosphatase (KDO 8-P phosphatase)